MRRVALLLLLVTVGALSTQAQPVTRKIVPSLTEELKSQLALHNISVLLVLPGNKVTSNVSLDWEALSRSLHRVDIIRSLEDFTAHWHKVHSRAPATRGVKLEHSRGLRGWRSLLWHSSPQHSSQQHSRRLRGFGLNLLQLHLTGPVIDGKTLEQQRQEQQQNKTQDASQPAADSQLPEQPAGQQAQSQQPSTAAPPSPAEGPQQRQPRVHVALLTLGNEGVVHGSQASLATAIARRLRNAVSLSITHSSHRDKPETLVTFDMDGRPIAAAVQETSIFRDAFTAIYANKMWGAGGGGSGDGSTLDYTATVRGLVSDVLTRYNVSSMLDSSCGSMHWMPLVLGEREKARADFRFMGTDVVCMLIDQHKQTFSNHTNWDFQCVDYSAQPLPKGYELIFSRDSLQHIPMHGAWQFLNNVRASGAKYLLVGSYVKSAAPNRNIAGGEYYDIDLLKPPFNVSKPLEVFDEKVPDGKHLLLFEVAKMSWQDTLEGLV